MICASYDISSDIYKLFKIAVIGKNKTTILVVLPGLMMDYIRGKYHNLEVPKVNTFATTYMKCGMTKLLHSTFKEVVKENNVTRRNVIEMLMIDYTTRNNSSDGLNGDKLLSSEQTQHPINENHVSKMLQTQFVDTMLNIDDINKRIASLIDDKKITYSITKQMMLLENKLLITETALKLIELHQHTGE